MFTLLPEQTIDDGLFPQLVGGEVGAYTYSCIVDPLSTLVPFEHGEKVRSYDRKKPPLQEQGSPSACCRSRPPVQELGEIETPVKFFPRPVLA